MSYTDLPARTSPEDLLEVCQALREGGMSEEEIEETEEIDIGRDTFKYGLSLGFIERNEENVYTNTDRGTQLGYRDEFSDETETLFLESLPEYRFYQDLTIHLSESIKSSEVVTQKEILPDLRTEFGIRELSDDMLKRITRAYLKTLDKAGFGDYITGRRGKSTRIDLGENAGSLVSQVTGNDNTGDGEEDTAESDEAHQPTIEESVEEPEDSSALEVTVDEGESPEVTREQAVESVSEIVEASDGVELAVNIEISSSDWDVSEVIELVNALKNKSE